LFKFVPGKKIVKRRFRKIIATEKGIQKNLYFKPLIATEEQNES